jgi:hypothetical protein
MATKYSNCIEIRPNGHTNIFHCKTLQNLPKLGFSFENMPSGNPAVTRLVGDAALAEEQQDQFGVAHPRVLVRVGQNGCDEGHSHHLRDRVLAETRRFAEPGANVMYGDNWANLKNTFLRY